MKSIRLFIGLLLIFSTMFIACVEDDAQYQFSLEDEYPISTHIGMQAEYSLWKDVMTKGDLYASFNVAGNYTMLVPNNESLSKLFETKPFEEWTSEECKELVYNHSFPSKLPRGGIREGALDDLTLNGKFIRSEFGQGDGAQVVILNHNVILKGLPFEATNGYVYGVNGVLINLEKDVLGLLMERGDCSFFLEALEATGIRDKMEKHDATLWNGEVVKLVWTVFAVADSIYKEAEITSYEQLKNYYTRNDPAEIKDELTNSTNGLFLHISKHLIDEEVYSNTMMTYRDDWAYITDDGPMIPTVNTYACIGNTNCLQAGEVNGTLVVNPNLDKTDYTLVFSDKSNLISTNGCVHYVNRAVDGVDEPFREPIQTIFHDVRLTDSIEDYGERYGRNWTNRPIKHGVIAEWKWHSEPEEIDVCYAYVDAYYHGAGGLLSFDLGGVNSGWIEFETCPIPAGTYDGILSNSGFGMHAYIDNPEGGIGIFNLYVDGELNGTAYKTYIPDAWGTPMNFNNENITFTRGGRHTLRFEYVSGAGNLRIGDLSFYP